MTREPQPPSPNTSAELFDALYTQLREIATRHLTRLPPGGTLTPTALIHEAYLRFGTTLNEWGDRRHFLNAAALAMRHVVVDHVREKGCLKRGGGHRRLPLDEDCSAIVPMGEELLDLDDALTLLAIQSEPAAQVVILRFFTGAEWDEVARALDLPHHKVKSLWAFARAWLYRHLQTSSA